MEITDLLFLFIGLLVGGLVALLFDMRFLGRRLMVALDDKRRLQAQLAELNKKPQSLDETSRTVTDEGEDDEQVENLPDDSTPGSEEELAADGPARHEPVPDADLTTFQDNLTRMSNHVEVLQSDKHSLQVQAAAADARAETLEDQLGSVRHENRELQERNEQLQRQLGAAEVESRYLRRDLREALGPPWEDQPAEGDDLSSSGSAESQEPYAEELTLVDDLFIPDEASPFPFADESVAASPDSAEEPGIELDAAEELSHEWPIQIDFEADSKVQELRGIGPVYARRLNDAGIHSVADLASHTPEQLSQIVGLRESQHGRPTAWLAQAQAVTGEFNASESRSSAGDAPPPKDLSRID
jgi:predicted flap endonuclease-1-like 5' DNA nuclease